MWRSHHAVLIGNPGVSKSWFQWYMMYRLVNHVDVGANEDGYNRPTRLIVRQTGIKTMDFYFPSQEKVFRSSYKRLSSLPLLEYLEPDTSVYLFVPRDDQKENISHFILCYDVDYDHEYKNGACIH